MTGVNDQMQNHLLRPRHIFPAVKVLVFDLDDTLYDEITYVHSGLAAVANFAHQFWKLDADLLLQQMKGLLQQQGRGVIFDTVLKWHGVYSRKAVRQCLQIYRSHVPEISLYLEAEHCLRVFQQWPLYIVTDGHKMVQDSKLKALDLWSRMKHCYITHRYGCHAAKPSSHCFELIALREKCENAEIIYVGDNPHKDFVGIKQKGFATIRVLQGQYRTIHKPAAYEAHRTISSLWELPLVLNERSALLEQ